jgi:hypothetical protein
VFLTLGFIVSVDCCFYRFPDLICSLSSAAPTIVTKESIRLAEAVSNFLGYLFFLLLVIYCFSIGEGRAALGLTVVLIGIFVLNSFHCMVYCTDIPLCLAN